MMVISGGACRSPALGVDSSSLLCSRSGFCFRSCRVLGICGSGSLRVNFLQRVQILRCGEFDTKAIRVFRAYDACFDRSKNFSARVAAGVVVACTSSQSSSGSQLDDGHEHRQSYESTESVLTESRIGGNSVSEGAVADGSDADDGNETVLLHRVENENVVPDEIPRKKSGRQKRAEVVEELQSGRSPLEVLESMTKWSPPVFWAVVDYLHAHRRMHEALEMFKWWKQQDGYRSCELHYTKFIRMLGKAHMPVQARALFVEMCGLGLRPSAVTYTCLLQSCAECGQFEEAELLLKDMVLSGDAKPNTVTYTGLIHAYGKYGMYDDMWRTFNRMKIAGIPADEFTYRTLIKAYAQGGHFDEMQLTVKEMSRNDMYADSPTMNAVVQAYAEAGLVKEMEKHYEILLKYSFIPGHKTIKAMVSAYVKKSLFFQLSRFVKRVGLRRRTVGNYLWNALLLSRAANFAMEDLKIEFENMKYAGFFPDLTTCNIMALAYSRMKQFWELHELVIMMQDNGIVPDLVTYGAVIDVFIEEDLRPKLLEELLEFKNLGLVAEVETDPLVFEVFGKGEFLIACETLSRNMEGQGMDHRTFVELVGYYFESLNMQKRPRRRVLSP
ncbi:hypothetical protein KC19_4G216100 [Ceratodon purpureus]|uniref:Pentatricopeptide repeat-containing protein n=1 Tax=Ceratodon purpureus TaxID=3225 RepID=A0A8T0IB84_CERPU|nr:hypothetical protein KC19_4G216100 [Ceratodon purpureus]